MVRPIADIPALNLIFYASINNIFVCVPYPAFVILTNSLSTLSIAFSIPATRWIIQW